MRGVAISPDGQEMAGMGIGVGDYDLDGHLDVVKTHFQLQATGLYKNDGKGELRGRGAAGRTGRGTDVCELGDMSLRPG